LNTPRVITDSGNNIVWQWENSDPFGNNVPVANGGFEFNLRFPGQYYDRETNLHYNYYRDYDPAIGRYIQSDPIGLGGGINTYAYVLGNPLRFADPLGLDVRWGVYGDLSTSAKSLSQ
jgi:RHS repeat-associated protein